LYYFPLRKGIFLAAPFFLLEQAFYQAAGSGFPFPPLLFSWLAMSRVHNQFPLFIKAVSLLGKSGY